MKLGLINSAWAQAGRDTAYGLRKTRELGFDTVDIFADPLDTSAAERAMIRSTCDDLDLVELIGFGGQKAKWIAMWFCEEKSQPDL